MSVKLAIRGGSIDNLTFELHQGKNTVGRAVSNSIWIDDPCVSLFHCELTLLGDSVVVKDLGSSNGTWINESKVSQRVLRDGEILRLGELSMALDLGDKMRRVKSLSLNPPGAFAGSQIRLDEVNRTEFPSGGSPRGDKPSANAILFPKGLRIRFAFLALIALGVLAWYSIATGLRSNRLKKCAAELGGTRMFFGDPMPNHSGSRVIFLQTTETGIGLHIWDTVTGRSKLVYEHPERLQIAVGIQFLGWSPDDQYFAYARHAGRREIVICDGDSCKTVATISVGQRLKEGTWLTSQRIVYSDNQNSLFESRQTNGKWGKPKPFRFCSSNPTNLPPITKMQALTRDKVLWQQGNEILSCDAEADAPIQEWASSTNELLGFAYSRMSYQLLLLCKNQEGHVLYSLEPKPRHSESILRVVAKLAEDERQPRAVFWLSDGLGYGYCSEDELGRDKFTLRSSDASASILSCWESIYSFSIRGDQLFVVGSVASTNATDEYCFGPTGIWRYDIARSLLNCVVSNSALHYARFVPPEHLLTTNSKGNRLAYTLIPPTRFEKERKHPAVIGFDWMVYQQASANAGAFYASVSPGPNGWAGNIMTVYAELLKNHNINTNLIYLMGASAGVNDINALVQREQKWHGAILFSPVSFPMPSHISVSKVLVDCGGADRIAGDDGRLRLKQFQDASLRSGIPVRVLIHPNAGHNYRSVAVERARVRELMLFLKSP